MGNLFVTIGITADLLARAADLAEEYALRGYDAVQLAAAVQLRMRCLRLQLPLDFVSGDADLNAAAQAENLGVTDPTTHP